MQQLPVGLKFIAARKGSPHNVLHSSSSIIGASPYWSNGVPIVRHSVSAPRVLEEVINVRTPCIIGHYCGATKTNEAMSVTANCSRVSVHKIPGTACLTGSSECREDRSNTCPKFTNDRTVGMYFRTVASATK